MKVLLCNKFYYNRGGDCIYTMNLEQMLKSHGHDVAVFSMDYSLNDSSEWSSYWPSNMTKIKAFTRPFGDSEVKKKFTSLCDSFKPEVVHLNNIHTQLSPIIAKIAHEKGIRVVWTLHDSKLVCPCYTCTRNGNWCEECFTDKKAVIKHRCMPGSIPGAVIGYFEAKKWDIKTLSEYTDVFITPSQFMADVCIKGGYSKEKFKVLCNFIDLDKVKDPSFDKEDYYVFVGRLTKVKGISTLCKAAASLPYILIVIGSGDLEESLKEQYKDSNILFLGQKNWDQIRPVLEKAKFMVLPAEWSENNPLTIIESQSLGTPVLGARIGGIPELIEEKKTGLSFISGDCNDLRDKIQKMWEMKFDYSYISEVSQKRYCSESYYNNLMKIYEGE